MELSQVSIKHINELEQQITNMLKTMRTAKLHEHSAYEVLQALEQELGEIRRERYDKKNSEFRGF